jgi:hypothetical protein
MSWLTNSLRWRLRRLDTEMRALKSRQRRLAASGHPVAEEASQLLAIMAEEREVVRKAIEAGRG